MPDEPDEHPAPPPLKVMRKRLNGVYRADSGFSGPTRRYVLIVALLVLLASVPTAAAITAGTNELAGGKSDTMDIPVLPPASPGPVRRTRPASPVPGGSPGAGSPPPGVSSAQGEGGAEAAVRAGRLMGKAGKRRPVPPRSDRLDTGDPSMSAFPALPGMPRLPGVADLSGMSYRPPGTEESAGAADQESGGPATRARPSLYHRGVTVHIAPGAWGLVNRPAEHRPEGRSQHRRRSTVADRPRNARLARILDRQPAAGTHHDNRRHPPELRGDDNRTGWHAYDGAHRAGGRHHWDENAAQRRGSRIGRHHAEPTEDLSGRW